MGDYGDNDDEELTPGSRDVTAPLWNNGNGILVTRAEYNSENQVEWTYDALNRKSQTVYDDAGRVVKTVQNYVDDDPESDTADEDVTVLTSYTADGQIATYTAVNPETDDQVTQYAYGTTLADSGRSSFGPSPRRNLSGFHEFVHHEDGVAYLSGCLRPRGI